MHVRLRIFAAGRTGYGYNRVCYTHVDNYAHALIISERALYPDSPALGKFYIVTDGLCSPVAFLPIPSLLLSFCIF